MTASMQATHASNSAYSTHLNLTPVAQMNLMIHIMSRHHDHDMNHQVH